jgi:hypothetical protein
MEVNVIQIGLILISAVFETIYLVLTVLRLLFISLLCLLLNVRRSLQMQLQLLIHGSSRKFLDKQQRNRSILNCEEEC